MKAQTQGRYKTSHSQISLETRGKSQLSHCRNQCFENQEDFFDNFHDNFVLRDEGKIKKSCSMLSNKINKSTIQKQNNPRKTNQNTKPKVQATRGVRKRPLNSDKMGVKNLGQTDSRNPALIYNSKVLQKNNKAKSCKSSTNKKRSENNPNSSIKVSCKKSTKKGVSSKGSSQPRFKVVNHYEPQIHMASYLRLKLNKVAQ